MRTFILYARKAVTSPDFNIEDLPSSGGRMDLIARCISSALFLSFAMRRDSRIFVVLNGPPNPPVTVCFDGSITNVSPDEQSIALWIKKALEKIENFKGKDWISLKNNIKVSRKSFQDIIKESQGSFYILYEKGEPIEKVKIAENPIIILGDHLGLPSKEEKFALRYGKKISLGKTSYLASQCIAIVNWMFDEA